MANFGFIGIVNVECAKWDYYEQEPLHLRHIYALTEDEHINMYGEKLMVVDAIVQECSINEFFTDLLVRMGVYDEDNGDKVLSADDASKLICSAKGMEVVSEMFNDYHIQMADPNEGVLVEDYLKATKERIEKDLMCAKYLHVIYGGDYTIDGLIAYLSDFVNKNK